MDKEYEEYLVHLLLQNYGDLLKVSRSRGAVKTLPQLRKYIKENNAIANEYNSQLLEEVSGMALDEDAVLLSLIQAQIKSLKKGTAKNNTQFADEIKKTIQKGKSDHVQGEVVLDGDEIVKDLAELVQEVLNTPLEVEIDKIPAKVWDEVRKELLNPVDGFRKFSLLAFQLQLGFPFQEQDFHALMFDVCQRAINGEEGYDRVVITIPPRHSKTQIMSIFLPLYSFAINPSSHNIITSYADDVVSESSGYIRAIMTDPMFSKIFPRARIDQAKRSLERWGTTKAGVMHAVPTGGESLPPNKISLIQGTSKQVML